jgi:hypothetical protein
MLPEAGNTQIPEQNENQQEARDFGAVPGSAMKEKLMKENLKDDLISVPT